MGDCDNSDFDVLTVKESEDQKERMFVLLMC